MTNKEAIEILEILKANYSDACLERLRQACDMAIDALGADNNVGDMISRQVALKEIEEWISALYENAHHESASDGKMILNAIKHLPSAEPLTDREQMIFLAAMGREEKVCEEVDRNHIREAYEDSLMWVCKEIKRKVKGALWT